MRKHLKTRSAKWLMTFAAMLLIITPESAYAAATIGNTSFSTAAGSGAGTGDVITITAGQGGATGAGGTVTVTSGAGGGTSGASGAVTVQSGAPTDGNSGAVTLQSATAVGTNRDAGQVSITGGNATGTGQAGYVVLTAGNANASANAATDAGDVDLNAGNGGGALAGGDVLVDAGQGGATGAGGTVVITSGAGGGTSGASGAATFTSGVPTDGNSGLVTVSSGNAVGTNRDAGNVAITGGNATGTGQAGYVVLTAGNANASANAATDAGDVDLNAGTGGGALAGGDVLVDAGQGGATGAGGTIVITSGAGGATSGASGAVTLRSGTPTDGNSGAVTIQSVNAVGTARNSGAVAIGSGNATTSGEAGDVTVTAGNAAAGDANTDAGDIGITAGTGGTGNFTGGNADVAGGAGGTGGTGGIGGAGTLTGGAGGVHATTSAAGGTGDIAGGAGGANSTNAGTSGAGGAATLVGGAGGLSGGASGTGGAGGAVTITAGAGGGANGGTQGNGGTVTINGGDGATDGNVNIATANTVTTTIGNATGAAALALTAGTGDVQVNTADEIRVVKSATGSVTMDFRDYGDTTDDDMAHAILTTNCTTTTSAGEDCDFSIGVVEGGAAADTRFTIDGDGAVSIGSANVSSVNLAPDNDVQILNGATGNVELSFHDYADSADDDMAHALVTVNCTTATSGGEDCDFTVGVVEGGAAADTRLNIDGDGAVTLGSASVTSVNLIADADTQLINGASGNVDLSFHDYADSADDDMAHVLLRTNCTDATSGAEDCDFTIGVAEAGAAADTRFNIDGDGAVIIGSANVSSVNLVPDSDVQIQAGASGNVDLTFHDYADTTDDDMAHVVMRTNCTDAGTGAEDCDFTIGVVEAGAAADTRFSIDADGAVSIGSANVTSVNLTPDSDVQIQAAASGNVDLSFHDYADSADDDMAHALLRTNCTDATSGAEDCDFSISIVEAGAAPDIRMNFDADGGIALGNQNITNLTLASDNDVQITNGATGNVELSFHDYADSADDDMAHALLTTNCTTATSGGEDCDFTIGVVEGGAAAETRFNIDADGGITVGSANTNSLALTTDNDAANDITIAGGVNLTGNLAFTNGVLVYDDTNAEGACAGNAVTIDLSLGNFHTADSNGAACTITFSNGLAGELHLIELTWGGTETWTLDDLTSQSETIDDQCDSVGGAVMNADGDTSLLLVRATSATGVHIVSCAQNDRA